MSLSLFPIAKPNPLLLRTGRRHCANSTLAMARRRTTRWPPNQMTAAQLPAVVEVPRDDRVRCQAAGCNHPVFRRIHVVREDAVVCVYGSECFKRLFAGLPVASSTPRYTSSEGRRLSEEERQLLIENTERLIQQFESAHQEELARQAAHVTPGPPSARATPGPVADINVFCRWRVSYPDRRRN